MKLAGSGQRGGQSGRDVLHKGRHLGRRIRGRRGRVLRGWEAGEGATVLSGTEAGLAPSRGGTWVLKEPLAAVWLGSVWEVGGDTARWEPAAESRGCCNHRGNRQG